MDADLNVTLTGLLEAEILDSSNKKVVIKGSREEGIEVFCYARNHKGATQIANRDEKIMFDNNDLDLLM
tara:strand:+ start:5640 stop:5846 length:207 start_codon:yes stop_codon:yes gene_type:complete